MRRGWKSETESCLDDDGCCCPPSPYRFLFLLQRAVETAGEVRAFGAELLAAFEKGDAEFLAAMRAAHERQLLGLTEELRRLEFRDADWQVQALKKSEAGGAGAPPVLRGPDRQRLDPERAGVPEPDRGVDDHARRRQQLSKPSGRS